MRNASYAFADISKHLELNIRCGEWHGLATRELRNDSRPASGGADRGGVQFIVAPSEEKAKMVIES